MSYVAPQARNGVFFTKNLTSDNYIRGVGLLRYYFNASKISKAPYYPLTNFDGMLGFLKTNYPTYIESLGELMNTVDEGKLIQAMKDAAAKGRTDYPRPAYFAESIIANTGYTLGAKLGDIAGAIGDTVTDLSKAAFWFSVVGLLVIGYIEFGPMIKVMIKKAKAV